MNDDLREYCRRRPVTLLAYAALLAGAYTRVDRQFPGQYRGPDADARLAALRAMAVEKNITMNQVVLAWMLNSNPFVLPLIAASSEEQLKENIQALDISLSPDEMKFLDEAGC